MRWPSLIPLLAVAPGCATSPPVPDDGAPDAVPPHFAARFTRLSRVPASTGQGGATVEATDQQLLIGIGRTEVGRYAVDVGLDYQYSRYEYTGIDSRNRDQHRLQLPIRVHRERAERRFEAWLAPGVSTSSNVFQDPLDRWRRDDLTVAAGAEWQLPVDARWRLVAGFAHDATLGVSAAYPIAGVRYAPDRDLSLRLAFPDSELRYAPGPRQALTLRVYPAGHEWHVVSDAFDRDFTYRLRALRSEGTWSIRVRRGLSLDLTLGFESRRRHRFRDDAGMPVDAHADDEWLLAVGFRAGRAPLPRAHGAR